MLKIYLCEDDGEQLEHWKNIIEKYLIMHDMDMELFCWTTQPAKLLEYLETADSVGVYFLDLDLKAEINGLELAGKIRERDPRGYLVFITTHDEMAPLTFKLKVEALDFILKDEPEKLEERIRSCMEAACSNYQRWLDAENRLLIIKVDNISIQLNQDEILYIASGLNSHSVEIYTWQAVRRIPGTLKEVAAHLNCWFCYCNRSTIVNVRNVETYSAEERLLFMKNGASCKASFRMAGEIQRVLRKLNRGD